MSRCLMRKRKDILIFLKKKLKTLSLLINYVLLYILICGICMFDGFIQVYSYLIYMDMYVGDSISTRN